MALRLPAHPEPSSTLYTVVRRRDYSALLCTQYVLEYNMYRQVCTVVYHESRSRTFTGVWLTQEWVHSTVITECDEHTRFLGSAYGIVSLSLCSLWQMIPPRTIVPNIRS